MFWSELDQPDYIDYKMCLCVCTCANTPSFFSISTIYIIKVLISFMSIILSSP